MERIELPHRIPSNVLRPRPTLRESFFDLTDLSERAKHAENKQRDSIGSRKGVLTLDTTIPRRSTSRKSVVSPRSTLRSVVTLEKDIHRGSVASAFDIPELSNEEVKKTAFADYKQPKSNVYDIEHPVFWLIPRRLKFVKPPIAVHLPVLVVFIISLLFILVAVLCFTVGSACLGTNRQKCLVKANSRCNSIIKCNGIPSLINANTCGCKCGEDLCPFTDLSQECECTSTDGPCMPLSGAIKALVNKRETKFPDLTEEALGIAFHLSETTCVAQVNLLDVFQNQSPWAEQALLRHFMLSADHNATITLAKQFINSKTATHGAITYDLEKKTVNYGVIANTTDSPEETLKQMQKIAKAMSHLREGYLKLYFKRILNITEKKLTELKEAIESKEIFMSVFYLDESRVTFKPRKNITSNLCLLNQNFVRINRGEANAFLVTEFPSNILIDDCLKRPAFGIVNVADLTTGGYVGDWQPAYVLKNEAKKRTTLSAQNPHLADVSPQSIGMFGALDHVLIEYLQALKDTELQLKVIQEITNSQGKLKLPELSAHVWGGVDTDKDVSHILAGLFKRVGQADLYYGTPESEELRMWAKSKNITLYWSRDPLNKRLFLDVEPRGDIVWSNRKENIDELWSLMTT